VAEPASLLPIRNGNKLPLMGTGYLNGWCARRSYLLLFLLTPGLLLWGCVSSSRPAAADDHDPQYHPNPPIIGQDGQPIPPPGFYDDKGRLTERLVDPELKTWMWYVNTNIAAGHNSYADAVGYVNGYDKLLSKHKGDKSVAAEQILRAKAFFYFGPWDDDLNGCRLFHQIMRDYPDTPFGRKLIKDHKGTKCPADVEEAVPPPDPP
jgi:hypothetical protein